MKELGPETQQTREPSQDEEAKKEAKNDERAPDQCE